MIDDKPNIVLIVTREEVEECRIDFAKSQLGSLSADRSSALSSEGSLTLIFDGYNSDPREIHTVSEVRAWFEKLNRTWPYWAFFANRDDHTIGLILRLLLPGQQTAGDCPGKVAWHFDIGALGPLMLSLYHAQNVLLRRLQIPESENRRASLAFASAVESVIS